MSHLPSVLVVEDDPLLLASLVQSLRNHFQVFPATNSEGARAYLNSNSIDCALLDLHLGHEKGQDLLAQWQQEFPEMGVVVLSGQTDIKLAIECIRLGASDYLVKPMEPDQVLFSLERTLAKKTLFKKWEKKQKLTGANLPVVTHSQALQEVLHKAQLLKNKTQLNVLILGESGTGKELLARFIHQMEEDPKRPFEVVNMPALPANLIEAELFGVEKGAYTDAKSSRAGKFELAHKGDIFLDEIGDLAWEMQSKLLRVLQERQVQRLGSHRTENLSFRVISATNRPLSEMIQSGQFREDLIYRLSDIVLTLPPLRERKEDIPLLAEHFIKKHSISAQKVIIPSKAMDKLLAYDWPGNIRQLESTLKRALIFSENGVIENFDIIDFKESTPPTPSIASVDFNARVKQFEKAILNEALDRHQGRKEAAMKELGLPKATFYRKLHELSPDKIDSRR